LIVVDASALLEALLLTEAGLAIGDRLFARSPSLHAPELIDLEIAQVLRRYELDGTLDDDRAELALLDLADVRLERWPHRALLPRIWELRGNLTAYDAAYVALAEALGAPLLTRDRRLAAAPHQARIEVV
jgi:predicted nucleic acid-binding protein